MADLSVSGVTTTAGSLRGPGVTLGFDEARRSTGVTYGVQVDGPSAEATGRLLRRADEVAKVPRALRAGVPVAQA